MWKLKRKKQEEQKAYHPETHRPVIRASICTGEQVAGFKHRENGKFEEAMLIRGEKDLQEFCETYGVNRKESKKEW